MSTAVTNGILITVKSEYIPERSSLSSRQFAFAYTVRIENQGSTAAQLRSRHWIITDGNGSVQEVRGDGVVGAQPTLRPGDNFEYTSWCVLATPSGMMRGTYQMVTDRGQAFDADIARYNREAPDLAAQARGFTDEYDALNVHDDQFDMAEALLSVAIALFGITALTRKAWLLVLALGFAACGTALGLGGFLGWNLHPDWLASLLG